MSFFIRLSELSSASLRGNGRDSSPLYLSATTGANTINCSPSSDLLLCDNSADGANNRINIVLVSSSPPLFAFSTQAYGSTKWVSYNPACPTLTLADAISDGETFSVFASDTISGACSIYNVFNNVYLTAYVMPDGNIGINGSDSQTIESQFVLDCTLGTGPVMPNRPYFIRSFRNQTIRTTAAGWFLDDLTDDLTDERIVFEPVSKSAPYFYRLRTRQGFYVAITDTGYTYMTEMAEGSEATFQLVPSATIIGSFQIINMAHNFCVRATTAGKLETGYRFDLLAQDMFSFETETPGPDPSATTGLWRILSCFSNRKQQANSLQTDAFALKVEPADRQMPSLFAEPRRHWCPSKVSVLVVSLCLLLMLLCAQIYYTTHN
eukprot:GILI01027581.1.p1 GENE.GILI01027581.1~~GILI01027581.1.p1  ORF type:complete len:379 (-),score=40.91 GILI01027581.1:137-1273(-)